MSWWEVHIILVSLSNVSEPTCHQLFLDCPPANGGPLMLDGTTVLDYRGFGELLWVDEDFKVLIWSVIDVMDDSIIDLKSYVSFIFYHQILDCWISSLACWLQFWIEWRWDLHHTYYRSCCLLLESWYLRYKNQYRRNRAMVMIWCYMANMSIDERITWRNQYVQNMIWVEEVWDIEG